MYIDKEIDKVRQVGLLDKFFKDEKESSTKNIQGITLPNVSLNLDAQMFEKGQAYTALSRCCEWDNIKIRSLNREAFAVDESMIKEYERLETVASNPLPLSRSLQNNR
ncbi:hypothetical protein Glove_267g53 [Diversispora epigaea]|uniref:Uncharacterized protein n=1 Tax=Diversispora epigaea TaxID=1348612 RepID=A0A397IBQ5_9GLOM|nr:hypothetical protein Glove_267g53 [Diversispora epigaea]